MHTKVGIKQFKLWSFDRFWGVWFIDGHVSYHQRTSTFIYALVTGTCTQRVVPSTSIVLTAATTTVTRFTGICASCSPVVLQLVLHSLQLPWSSDWLSANWQLCQPPLPAGLEPNETYAALQREIESVCVCITETTNLHEFGYCL